MNDELRMAAVCVRGSVLKGEAENQCCVHNSVPPVAKEITATVASLRERFHLHISLIYFVGESPASFTSYQICNLTAEKLNNSFPGFLPTDLTHL